MPDIVFQGPCGRIEGKYAPSLRPRAPAVLILHPHPQHGGSMNSKIVHALYRAFHACEFSVLRFNFRGVGHSEGVYDEGEGELNDAGAAFNWLQSQNTNTTPFWVAGFSFGAWIGMQLLMRRPELCEFVMVSPPADLYDFSFLSPCPTSGLILQGDQDDIVNKDSVRHLVQKLNHQKHLYVDYKEFEGADHFFTKHLKELQERVTSYVKERLSCITPVKNFHPKSVA